MYNVSINNYNKYNNHYSHIPINCIYTIQYINYSECIFCKFVVKEKKLISFHYAYNPLYNI